MFTSHTLPLARPCVCVQGYDSTFVPYMITIILVAVAVLVSWGGMLRCHLQLTLLGQSPCHDGNVWRRSYGYNQRQ
jgi:hypothetical protein